MSIIIGIDIIDNKKMPDGHYFDDCEFSYSLENKKVVGLYIRGFGLKKVPRSIIKLKSLQNLDLELNELTDVAREALNAGGEEGAEGKEREDRSKKGEQIARIIGLKKGGRYPNLYRLDIGLHISDEEVYDRVVGSLKQ